MLWPEPDLPRTSTARCAAKRLPRGSSNSRPRQRRPCGSRYDSRRGGLHRFGGLAAGDDCRNFRPSAARSRRRAAAERRLQLDSLGRVQLAAALEEKLGVASEGGVLDGVRTLGELRALVAGNQARRV